MPLQFPIGSLQADNISSTFSPLNRGNASAISTALICGVSTLQLSVPSIGAMPLQYHALEDLPPWSSRLSVPSIGAMPLQSRTTKTLIILEDGLSVPSIGAMPLQFSTKYCPVPA